MLGTQSCCIASWRCTLVRGIKKALARDDSPLVNLGYCDTGNKEYGSSRNTCMKQNIKADRTHGYNELDLEIVMI